MNRKEFMNQLEKLLSDISEDERREALDYYESYFDEAGEEEEASVIQKLGSPGKVAAIIKADLRENSASSGTYTENGYYDERMEEPGQMPGERGTDRKERGYQPKEKRGRGKLTLILILLIFLSPFLAGATGGVIGVLVTVIFLPFLLVFGAGVGVLGMLIGGITMIFTGIGLCFSTAAAGILTVGIGCIFMAIGLAGLVFVVWIVGSLFPRFLRWFTDWCHRLLSKERKDGKTV